MASHIASIAYISEILTQAFDLTQSVNLDLAKHNISRACFLFCLVHLSLEDHVLVFMIGVHDHGSVAMNTHRLIGKITFNLTF